MRFSLLLMLLCVGLLARAEEKPFLHSLFTDNMVLQRNMKVPVWGWTYPGAKVTVQMQGKSASAAADASGKWLVKLGSFPAGGPYSLTISGPQTVTLMNVLVGDVWLCAGQSNMDLGVTMVDNADVEVAHANYSKIRLCQLPRNSAFRPAETLPGTAWQICTPESIANGYWGGFSAVAYFFGRKLHKDLNVPIGLIQASCGGSPAELWTSAEALKTMADFRPYMLELEKDIDHQLSPGYDHEAEMRAWWAANDSGTMQQPGWADPAYDDSAWKTIALPATFSGAGLDNFDGVAWFRFSFTLPEGWAGKDLILNLGAIDDRDTTWVNGEQVGATEYYRYNYRNYNVPAAVLKPGRNVIAVRVLDIGDEGGFTSEPELLKLEVAGDETASISLAGEWHYQRGVALSDAQPLPVHLDFSDPGLLATLYNGMIAPMQPFGIKGAIWYQGESNAGQGRQYQTLLPLMISDWRSRFGVGDFPFLLVQLPSFGGKMAEPGESTWAEIREAQLLTAQQTKNAGLAVAIDLGESADLHPPHKQEVGRRLALAAEALVYGKKLEYSGPIYKSMKVRGSEIRLTFSHVGKGLVAKDGKLTGFALAGADKKFVWADARIDGKTVVVSSPAVPKPVAVRYAWADDPICNLYNAAGLPASPFRTDQNK